MQKHAFCDRGLAGRCVHTAVTWLPAVNRFLAGRQTPAAALKQAQREAQAAIDSAAHP